MKIGISVTSNFPAMDARVGIEWMVNRVRAARDSRLDSLFVGDYHASPFNYIQNTPILGRLLAEWYDRPAGALFLLPLWHPVVAAEQIGTLACISRTPFIMQCGLGDNPSIFAALGVNYKHRVSRFEECLALMRALWAGETVSSRGHWTIDQACINPVPPSPVEVWIAASAPAAIDRAARLGDALLAHPGLTPVEARRTLDLYRECRARHGRSAATVALRKDIYIAASGRDAQETMELVSGYRDFDPAALIVAEPEAAAEQMRAYEAMGYTDLIIRNLHPDPDRALASLRRLGDVKALLQG